jgi:hypothetical protein
MLKNLLLILFLSASLSSQSQTSIYHPFPDSNVVWNVEGFSLCFQTFLVLEWLSYVVDSDTVIGPDIYHKVYVPFSIKNDQCLQTIETDGRRYTGAYRQDTSAKTVYYVADGDTSEKLLYNFNLHVGDTVSTYCNIPSIISEEDSVFINGNYRKRWKMNFLNGPNYIIEGIGFTGGPFSPLCNWEPVATVLVCCTQDNVILFQDSLYTTTPGLCDVINAVRPVIKNPEVNVYPNPFHDYATLELSNFPATLEIYNLPGIKVSDQEIISNQTIIQTNHLENGFYFYIVKNSSGETSSGKFVKD